MNSRFIKPLVSVILLSMLFTMTLFPDTITDLEQALQQAPDVEKSVILNKILKHLREKDERWDDKQTEKVRKFTAKALEYARTYQQKDQEVYALAHLGYFYRKQRDFEQALYYANKSLELAERRKKNRGIVYALDVVAIIHTEIPDFRKAFRMFKRMRPIYIEMGDKKKQAQTANRLSIAYSIFGEKKKELELKEEALRLFREVGDYDEIAHMLADIASFHSSAGDTEKALSYYLKALKIAGETVSARRRGRINQRLGTFYKNLKQYHKAEKYCKKAIHIYRTNNLMDLLSVPYIFLGELFVERKEYDQALSYFNRAMETLSQQKFTIYNNPAPTLNKIGQIYFKKKEYRKALAKHKDALGFYLRGQNVDRQVETHHHISDVYLALNDLKKAYENLEKSRKLLKKLNQLSLKRDNHKLFSDYYEKIGNYKKSLAYHRMYADLNLKIYDEESAKNITEMQTKYETEKKEKEIELLKKKEEIRELSLSKQKIIRNVSIAGFVLILIVMILFVNKYYYLLAFWKKKTVIGCYKVMDKIGSGGMGIVYKAHDVRDRTKTFAIKVLREEYFDDEHYKKRFKHEALVTDQLNHPNIIKINERGETAGNLYIAMELLSGKTLDAKLLEEGRLDFKICIHIMKQVTGALVSIHGKNIIHRDLKPANIMLVEKEGDENFVKLLDFGLARAEFQTRMTRTGIMVGTTNYLSPEQITNSGISTISDIFSLGIVFYEMVCGSKPFFGESESDIIMAILDAVPVDPVKIRPETPAALDELIKKMLTKDKESRPNGEEILTILKTINETF